MPLALEHSPRSETWSVEETTPFVVTNFRSASVPLADDLYRDDPYRFDEGSLDAEPSAPDDIRRIDYIPSPDEIAGACAQIRAQWTASEKRRRFVGELPPEAFDDGAWAPPVIDTSHFRHASTGAGDAI